MVIKQMNKTVLFIYGSFKNLNIYMYNVQLKSNLDKLFTITLDKSPLFVILCKYLYNSLYR